MNAIVVVDKPAGITSHDVVARLRRIYNTRRVGHSGTLDPIATGVLPVFVGRATRACEFAAADDKVYKARLKLGVTTDTQDITGKVIAEKPVNSTCEDVKKAARRFLGDILQTPPMYSAIKINGRKLYEFARDGVEVKRDAREITIHEIKVSRVDETRYDLAVSCSKGTYIRTLCSDIGDVLGCGGTLEELRRLKSGCFDIHQSKTLEQLELNPDAGLIAVDYLFSEHKRVELDEELEKKCRNGALVPFEIELGQKYRVYSKSGEFLMLAEGVIKNERSFLATIKSFWMP